MINILKAFINNQMVKNSNTKCQQEQRAKTSLYTPVAL